MNAIETLKQRVAELEQLNTSAQSELTTVRASLAAITADRDASQLSLKEAQAAQASLTAERDADRSELATAREALTAREATITTQVSEISTLKSEATTVEQKAQRLLATQGHAPLKLTPGTETKVEAVALKAKSQNRLEAAIEQGLERSKSNRS